METARRYAGAAAVDCVHLALGLWHDAEGAAFAVARRCGADLAAWPRRQAAVLADEPAAAMTLSAERAVRQARSLAREYFVDRTVTSELLLIAVLESDPHLAAELADTGLDVKKLRQLIIDPLTTPIPLEDSTPVAQAMRSTSSTKDARIERILDAVGNRAREALRVLEDYARFGHNDASMTAELKSLRHELAALLARWPTVNLLAARDTIGDVGTGIATNHEYRRTSVADVVSANLRRLQEALRSLEEFGKIRDPDLGRRFEALRYRTYTLEKRLITANPLRDRLHAARLYLLFSTKNLRRPWQPVLHSAIAGGVQIVQLREKHCTDAEVLTIAQEVRQITSTANTIFIMNDRVDLALASGADGVHIGQDDVPLAAARTIAGDKLLLGVSTHDLQQLRAAIDGGADYVGVGPTFPSFTKSFDRLAGLEFVAQSKDWPIPSFVLGGVSVENLASVIAAGGQRIAVSQAILQADDPEAAARQLRRRMEACAGGLS
jgi:thiamine-phosphate pyrophosphorylase